MLGSKFDAEVEAVPLFEQRLRQQPKAEKKLPERGRHRAPALNLRAITTVPRDAFFRSLPAGLDRRMRKENRN